MTRVSSVVPQPSSAFSFLFFSPFFLFFPSLFLIPRRFFRTNLASFLSRTSNNPSRSIPRYEAISDRVYAHDRDLSSRSRDAFYIFPFGGFLFFFFVFFVDAFLATRCFHGERRSREILAFRGIERRFRNESVRQRSYNSRRETSRLFDRESTPKYLPTNLFHIYRGSSVIVRIRSLLQRARYSRENIVRASKYYALRDRKYYYNYGESNVLGF